MWRIPFEASPATVTVGEGLTVAASYLRSTWDLWLLPVVLLAAVDAITAWLFGQAVIDQRVVAERLQAGDDAIGIVGDLLGPAIVGGLITLAASIGAGWVFNAIAIAGLRGRGLDAGWIVGAGLRSLVAGALTVAAGLAVLLPFVLLAFATTTPLVLVLGVVPALYIGLRLWFWELAIFDGAGIEAGFRMTLAITSGSVLRVFGWTLAISGIGFLVGLVSTIASLVIQGAPWFASAIDAALQGVIAAYSAVVIAVLYESQRLRLPAWSPFAPPAPRPTSSARAAAERVTRNPSGRQGRPVIGPRRSPRGGRRRGGPAPRRRVRPRRGRRPGPTRR